MSKMHIVMFSIDPRAHEKGSPVWRRFVEYSQVVDRLSVIAIAPFNWKGDKVLSLGDNGDVYLVAPPVKILFFIKSLIVVGGILSSRDRKSCVVTTQDPFELGFLGLLVKWIWNIPLNVQVHTDPFSPYFFSESIFNRVRYLMALFVFRFSDSIRTVSKVVLKNIESRYPGIPVISVPIRVEIKTSVPRSTYRDNLFTILALSRLEPVKNNLGIIRAFRKIADEFPNIRLRIIGSGSEEFMLRNEIKKINLSDKIEIVGWTNNVDEAYESADCFILNSWYEGWGMTVIEATTHRVPIIMTSTGCAGDFLLDGINGIVIPPGDEGALVAAMRKMYTDVDFRNSCVEHGLSRLETLPDKDTTLALYIKSWALALSHSGHTGKN